MRILDSPISAEREASPLCSNDFRQPLGRLRPVIPPIWLKAGLWAGGVATIICTFVVLLSPMDEYVTAPGVVRPADFAFVFSRADGILESVSLTDGMRVNRGDVLARLEDRDIRKEIVRLEGELDQARSELELAKIGTRKVTAAPVPPEFLFSALEVERQSEVREIQREYYEKLRELQRTGAASGSEMLNVRLQLIASEALLKRSQQANELFTGDYGAAARDEALARERVNEARVRALESQLAQARADLLRMEILAPESGVIISTARRFPGEKIRAGDTLFKITGTEGTELRLYATEDRVDRIAIGQLVRFRANNNPDRLAPLALGRVERVATDRDLESDPDSENKNTYRVSVAVEKTPYPLAVGATVQAEIVIARRPFWRLLFLRATDTM